MSITVKNLTKTYGAQKAVDAISFTVNKGEIVGFLGPNGAGKSTTMKMITGYLQPDSGHISVSGVDVLKDPLRAKKKIGYLPESNALYYDMFVREYLHFMADVHHLPNAKDSVEGVIKTVGLSLESNKKIGQLSKGYKQRVGLAAVDADGVGPAVLARVDLAAMAGGAGQVEHVLAEEDDVVALGDQLIEEHPARKLLRDQVAGRGRVVELGVATGSGT